jgi:hypothetical protein
MNRLAPLALAPALLLACYPEPEAPPAPEYARWAWCPDIQPSEAPGEDDLWLQISPSALYCGQQAGDAESVEEVFADRTQLRLVPGDFAIPLVDGEHPIHIQSCERGARDAVADEAGVATVAVSDILGRDRVEILVEQPMADGRNLQVHVAGWRDALAPGLLLDGTYRSRAVEPRVLIQVCDGPCVPEEEGEQVAVTAFDACNLGEAAPRERHRVVDEDGNEIELTLRNAGNNIQLIPELQVARGVVDGREFTVSGFFDMAVFSYGWSDQRSYLVRFEEPIGNVCGLKVEDVYPYDNAVWGGQVVRLRCDGSERTSRLVVNEFEIETPPEE